MTLRELERLRSIRAQISAEDEKIMRLRSRAERLTQVMTGMPHGGQREELADIIAQIVDMEAKAGRRVIEIERDCEAAMAWIDSLPEQQARVMRLYYVDGLRTWKEVADRLPYHYIHCIKIKNAAIANLNG